MWKSQKVHVFNKNSIIELIENKIPAVLLSGLVSKEQTNKFVEELTSLAPRTNSITEVTRLGISQYQQGLCQSKKYYFELAEKVNADFQEICSRSFSPVQEIIKELNSVGFDAAIMHEPDFGSYFAGNGKLRNGFSPIHVDFAPQDSQGWAIENTRYQLAWNLYLNVPDTGGELLLWDKQWIEEHDKYQTKDSYFYTEHVVEGLRPLKIKVEDGDIVFINSRNFHAVNEAKDRLAFGSFISVFDDGRMRLWS